ncbi:hypothetical protein RAS1_19520 [Phycisphaerae bacterium RAS1]|nr:hypothetical protein RAS1_19520 [Phycisphaerae bacterium RAS1]
MSKKFATLVLLATGYMALGASCIPNIGGTFSLTRLFGGLLGTNN